MPTAPRATVPGELRTSAPAVSFFDFVESPGQSDLKSVHFFFFCFFFLFVTVPYRIYGKIKKRIPCIVPSTFPDIASPVEETGSEEGLRMALVRMTSEDGLPSEDALGWSLSMAP